MRTTTSLAALAITASAGLAGAPEYTITDLGTVAAGDTFVQGFGISPGGVAFGRSVGESNQAFAWTPDTGIVGLPSNAGSLFHVANGANDGGVVVGVGAATLFGTGALPLMWTDGVLTPLPVLPGLGVARANDVNESAVVVGSSGGGVQEVATYWMDGVANAVTATTVGGAIMTTAFRVNDAGVAVGHGVDPLAGARNVALMYDISTGVLTEVPPLPGDNGGIAFDVSNNGFVVGGSSVNQTNSTPFIWSAKTGSVEVPLPTGASLGSARGVNSDGWAVGIGSGAFALPFLYDGEQTYLLQDLLPDDTEWDIAMNTSSSALGISEDGSIVGTGIRDGELRAYIMTLVDGACSAADLAAPFGELDIADVVEFLRAFGAGDPAADLAAPTGEFDIADVVEFLRLFGAGCP
ncbi:MAG: hypothetical protein CMJ31_06595 [Phycisphaerae bacterium]|nr:hypothetical protein [Phycisphaerae bacterium]